MDYTRLVVLFKARKNSKQVEEIKFFRERKSLKEAVEAAVMARTASGTMHPHQCRPAAAGLARAKAKLLPRLEEIRACRSFEALHDLIREITEEVNQFGPLCVYDTAFRIGVKLNLFPKRIYLHTGVRAGAKALGLDIRSDTLSINDLPPEMRVLKPHEAEDFLCIFHRQFEDPLAKWHDEELAAR